MASFFGALMLCPMVSALAFNAPQATPMADTVGLGAGIGMPQPTEAPNVQELHRRQDSNSLYLIEGPDEICGYQYGQSIGALRLCYTSTCGFATAPGGLGPNSGEIFCYDSTTSSPRPLWTSCIPGGTAGSSCLADAPCSNNRQIIVCTLTTEPYCNVGTFVGLGVEAVWCDSTYYTNMIPISTTYVGQFDRSLTTVFNSAVTSSLYTPPTPTIPSITVVSVSVSVSSTPATPSTSSSPQHSTPIGPIVGGVIGGLALIAAIAAGIFICLRIKRKDKQRAQQAPGPDYPVQASTLPTSPSGQNPSEKYPATTQATFVPAAAAFPASKPDQQYQYQQQYQPPPQQYQQPPQPQYQQAPPAQQQSPQSTGDYTQHPPPPQQSALKPGQAQYYPQQDFQTQAEAPGTQRDSISNASISSPGSPAPPYPSNFPSVPEMGEMSYHAYPQYPNNDRSEMP